MTQQEIKEHLEDIVFDLHQLADEAGKMGDHNLSEEISNAACGVDTAVYICD